MAPKPRAETCGPSLPSWRVDVCTDMMRIVVEKKVRFVAYWQQLKSIYIIQLMMISEIRWI